jgi:hypothetical protein
MESSARQPTLGKQGFTSSKQPLHDVLAGTLVVVGKPSSI